jgi:cell division protein FtsA
MIGKKNEYGKLEILGVGKSKSLGVAREITLRKPYNRFNKQFKAENNSGYKIKDVVVGIAGQHTQYSTHGLH